VKRSPIFKPHAFTVRIPHERHAAALAKAKAYGFTGLQHYAEMLIERDLDVPAGGNCSNCVHKLLSEAMAQAAAEATVKLRMPER
jgi:sugar phosphate isomerase/epimerase